MWLTWFQFFHIPCSIIFSTTLLFYQHVIKLAVQWLSFVSLVRHILAHPKHRRILTHSWLYFTKVIVTEVATQSTMFESRESVRKGRQWKGHRFRKLPWKRPRRSLTGATSFPIQGRRSSWCRMMNRPKLSKSCPQNPAQITGRVTINSQYLLLDFSW